MEAAEDGIQREDSGKTVGRQWGKMVGGRLDALRKSRRPEAGDDEAMQDSAKPSWPVGIRF